MAFLWGITTGIVIGGLLAHLSWMWFLRGKDDHV